MSVHSLYCSFLVFVSLAVLVPLTGCGGADAKSMIANANDMNVKRLATLYSIFHNKNNLKGPKNEGQLRAFVESQDPNLLKRGSIDPAKLDELFISERDGEPFVIRYRVNTVVFGPPLPVIFEATGVDGLRQVGFCNGPMQEVDEDEYERLLAGEADKEKVDRGRE